MSGDAEYTCGYSVTMPHEGWVCPRCGAVNAPHMQQCPCGGKGQQFVPFYPPPSLPYWPPTTPWPGWTYPYVVTCAANTTDAPVANT